MKRQSILFILMLLTAAFALGQTRPAAPGMVELSGRVVDDETGRPVNDFATQWGANMGPDGTFLWGYGTSTTSRRRNGEFNETNGWQAGTKVSLRIIADGYLPQPVTPEPLAAPAAMKDVVVRLKHGSPLRGSVVDHAGNPVSAAKVYLLGTQQLDIRNGVPQYFKGSSATADHAGRFALSGVDPATPARVVVVPKAGPVAVATATDPAAELVIRLPEPAAMTVNVNMPGGDPEAALRIELKTWEMPDWKGVTIVYEPTVKNPGRLELSTLAPGSYDFARTKTIRLADTGQGVLCDRQTITLEAGQSRPVDLLRTGAHSISGEIIGMKPGEVTGAFITVRSEDAIADPQTIEQAMLPIFDATACTPDAPAFRTAPLLPGTYTLIAEAYRPETAEEKARTGWRLPTLVGIARVTVPAEGAPEPIKIELKPRQ